MTSQNRIPQLPASLPANADEAAFLRSFLLAIGPPQVSFNPLPDDAPAYLVEFRNSETFAEFVNAIQQNLNLQFHAMIDDMTRESLVVKSVKQTAKPTGNTNESGSK